MEPQVGNFMRILRFDRPQHGTGSLPVHAIRCTGNRHEARAVTGRAEGHPAERLFGAQFSLRSRGPCGMIQNGNVPNLELIEGAPLGRPMSWQGGMP